MKRLLVFRVGRRRFAQAIESRRCPEGDTEEIRRLDIPLTQAEIEAYARENGYRLEWDSPPPSGDPTTGT